MKQTNKIPTLNQDFDLETFFTVLKKNAIIVAIIFVLAAVGGYFYFRYTQPVYTSTSVIQIKKENKTKEILGISNNVKMEPTLEIMRSNEFLKTVISNLPLEVSFFNEGTFLRTEIFGVFPFSVKYVITDNSIYDQKIYYSLDDNKSYYTIKIGKKGETHNVPFDEPTLLPEGVTLTLSAPEAEIKQPGLKEAYYFVINSDKSIMDEIVSGSSINILNDKAGTIEISYSNNCAQKSAVIANAIAEQFIDFDLMKNRESSLSTIAYIDEQMNNLVDELSQTERQLQQFRIDNGLTDEASIAHRNNLLSERITRIEQRIIEIDFEIETLREVESKMQSDDQVSIYELLALMAGKQTNAFIGPMLNSLQALISQRELLLFDVTENNHNIKVIDKRIATKRSTLLEFIASTILRLQKEKDDCNQRLAKVENAIIGRADYDEIEYSKLKRVYSINEKYYSQLLEAKTDILISQSGNVSTNLVLQRAETPQLPVSPILSKTITSALLLAIVLSVILLLIRYLFYNKINSAKYIDKFTTIPVIGEVLTSRYKTDAVAVVHLNTSSHLTENFRKIRTNLDFYPVDTNCRIILSTSTVPSEGKSFIAINLADIYSLTNRKVLLIDFDLRKPRLDTYLHLNNDDGVTTILTNKKSWQECVHRNVIDNLDVITSGPVSPVAAELLLSKGLENFVEDISKEYDIIVFDTSPVGLIHDAITLSKYANNLVYVMRSGVSIKGYIEFLNTLKEEHQLKNISIVLNGLPTKHSSSYGYYKGNYSKYGYYKE